MKKTFFGLTLCALLLAQALKETELAAAAFGAQLQYLDVRDPKDIERAFQAASKSRADGSVVLNGPPTFSDGFRTLQ